MGIVLLRLKRNLIGVYGALHFKYHFLYKIFCEVQAQGMVCLYVFMSLVHTIGKNYKNCRIYKQEDYESGKLFNYISTNGKTWIVFETIGLIVEQNVWQIGCFVSLIVLHLVSLDGYKWL